MTIPVQKGCKKGSVRIFAFIFFLFLPLVSSGYQLKNYNIEDGLAQSQVRSIFQDSRGNLWIGTYGGGVSKYNGLVFKNFGTNDGLSDNIISSIIEDHAGNIWFATCEGACKYDGRTFTSLTEEDGLSSNMVWSVIEDREGNLWFGTYRGGIDKYGSSPFTQMTTKEGLSDDVVRSILEDRKGNLWFCTYRGGVDKFDGKVFTNLCTKDGLVDNFVLTIFEDREGNLWFGTYRGVSKFDGKSFTNLPEKDGLSDNIVRSILEDQRGNLWFGTNRGGIYKYDGVNFTRFITEDGLNSNEIMTIYEDNKGNIWVGTRRGINIFNGKRFINFSEENGLKKNAIIYVILEDFEGNIWFGTYGGGIVKYTPSRPAYAEQGENDAWGGLFKTFTSKDGLHDDNIVSMIFDDAGSLWIGTEKGISRLNIEQLEKKDRIVFKHYGREEGFPGAECIHNSVCQDSRGNIWFGTLRGAIKYSAKDDRPNEVEPLTYIENLRIFFKEVDWSRFADKLNGNGLPIGLKLPYNQNHITFDFIGISLVIPEKVRYQYKLEGFDRAWSPINKEIYATYSNLPPGEYVFNVKACNNDGVWNKEPVSFIFKITPPFWKMWWFYTLVLLLGVGSIRAYTQLRVRKLERINLELEKLTLVASKTENAVMIADATGSIEWVNEGFTRMTGYTLEGLRELKKDTIAEITSASDITDLTDNGFIQEKSKTYESQINTINGTKIWISLSLTPIFDKNSELKKLVAIGTNITKRKQAEDALKESEKKYRELVERAGIAFEIDDYEGNIKYFNRKFAELFGYSMKTMKNQTIKSLVHPDDIDRVIAIHKGRLQGKTVPKRYEFRGVKKDGSTVCLEVDAALIKRDGNYEGSLSYLWDITRHRRAEEALRESEMKYRALFEYSNDAVFLLNLEGTHVMVNKKAADMLGYSIDELIGKSFKDIVAPHEYEKAQDILKGLLEGKTFTVYERIFRKKDGTEFPVEINVALVYDPEKRPLFIQSVVRDITDRKQAENKIKASLKEKDVMLREIHHRVKNNMQIILSLLRLQARSFKEKDIIEKLKVSQNRIKSMALIHETLYGSEDLVRIDFSTYVERLTTHLLSMYLVSSRDINLRYEVKNVFLDINRAIPCALILNELLSNSLEHAFPDAKTGEIIVKMKVDKRGKYELVVKDKGVGLPEGLDFRETETLGMQLVTDLVKQLDGTIELERTDGATFKIEF